MTIANAKLRDNLTIEKCAELFDVSESCINNALRWAQKNRVNNLAAAEDLQLTIVALEKSLYWLETQRGLKEKYSKDKRGNKRALPTTFLTAYLRESRALELAIAELKGIYRRAVDINIKADITTRHIDRSQLTDEDLLTIKKLQEKAYVHGRN